MFSEDAKHLEIVYVMDPYLRTAGLHFLSDSARLQQVIVNILANSYPFLFYQNFIYLIAKFINCAQIEFYFLHFN